MIDPDKQKPQQSSLPGEKEISPDKLIALNNTITTFLKESSPEREDYEDGYTVRSYDIDCALADGSHASISGVTLGHEDGSQTPMLLYVNHGSARGGRERSDDFSFTMSTTVGEVAEDESGAPEEATVGMHFTDTQAIDARKKVLLAQPEVLTAGVEGGVIMPNLGVTPAGDIYEDGQRYDTRSSSGALSVGMSLRFKDDAEVERFQRWQAAYHQARKDVGSGMTNERADRVIAVLAQALQASDTEVA